MDLILTSGFLLALVDPSDLTGTKLYPSGIKEEDKYHTNRWPSSQNPLLKIPYHFFNQEFEMCSPGVYDAYIKENKIILIQGSQIKAVLNANVEETSIHIEIPKAYAIQKEELLVITVFQNGQKATSSIAVPN